MTLTSQSNSDHAFASDITDDETHLAVRTSEPTAGPAQQQPPKSGYPIWRIAADSPHLEHLKAVLTPAAFVVNGSNADFITISPTSADEMLFVMTMLEHLERVA